jgi:hypothetical protein
MKWATRMQVFMWYFRKVMRGGTSLFVAWLVWAFASWLWSWNRVVGFCMALIVVYSLGDWRPLFARR